MDQSISASELQLWLQYKCIFCVVIDLGLSLSSALQAWFAIAVSLAILLRCKGRSDVLHFVYILRFKKTWSGVEFDHS